MRAPRVIAAGRGRRRLAATLALVIAITVVVVIILGTQSPSSLTSAADRRAQSSDATTVKRRDLVQTDTESGTLSYASPQTVYNRMTGTITWLPAVGQVIKPGQALYRVNGAPVILMDGSTPAYRDLSSSDSAGQDILQLNRNLVALGFNPDGIVVDDVWQAATTAGVELLEESLGETQIGSLSLGQIVFLPGSQVITTVNATVGSDGSGGGSNPNGSNASYTPSAPPSPEYVSLTTTTPTATNPTSPGKPKHHHRPHHNNSSAQTIATLRALLRAATAQLQAERAEHGSPGSNGNPGGSNNHAGNSNNNAGNSNNHAGNSNNHAGNGNHNSGNSNNHAGNSNNNSGNPGNQGNSGNQGDSGNSGGSGATAILKTTSTHLVVTVDLDATKQSEAKVGEQVTVEMPNSNTVNGKITAVSPVAQSSSDNGANGHGSNSNGGNGNGGNGNNGSGGNGSSGVTIPVTVALSGHQTGAGMDQAAVSVNFSEAKANNVLSVRVTALLATAGGGYAVQEATSPHTLIPVTTGLFAAGYVEISGSGIYPGLAVTDSQG
jgi:hypothetical protein